MVFVYGPSPYAEPPARGGSVHGLRPCAPSLPPRAPAHSAARHAAVTYVALQQRNVSFIERCAAAAAMARVRQRPGAQVRARHGGRGARNGRVP